VSWLKSITDEEHKLEDMALLVRRAGLEHLIVDPDQEELLALANAGDRLAMEREALRIVCQAAPHEALRPFDGGAMARKILKERAYALSRSPGVDP
jgi:hypothetical protein